MSQVEAQTLYGAGERQFTAGTTYSSGEVIELDDKRAGVVGGLTGAVSGDQVTVYTAGVFGVKAASATTFSAGDDVWWDASESVAVAESSADADADLYLGTAVEAKTNGQLTVKTDLNAHGCVMRKMGINSDPVSMPTALDKFIEIRTTTAATSGDKRLAYLRHYLTGAGVTSDCLRAFLTVSDVAAANAIGTHSSVNFGSTGSITGQAAGVRATLHVPNAALTGGTYSAAISELYCDGASSDISGTTTHAIHRFINAGNATGYANLENVLSFEGMNSTSVKTGTVGGTGKGIRVLIDGVTHYITVGTSCS